MKRSAAIDLLVLHALPLLSREEREETLLGWWTIDSKDPEYEALPKDLKDRLVSSGEPHDPSDSVYDPLLLLAGRHALVGSTNQYLEAQLERIGHKENVSGPVEVLEICPCCQYRSLGERAAYDICRVCFWEDDGTTELDVHSGPNHMTLRQAKANYRRLGAVSEGAVSSVWADGRSRFVRGTESPDSEGTD